MSDKDRIKALRIVLAEIERFGHSNGHGMGWTCANMAKEALEEDNKCLMKQSDTLD